MNNEDTVSVTALARSSVAEKTFLHLRSLYEQQGGEPGTLLKIGLKPGWTVVVGNGGECGTAFRFSGPHKVYDEQQVTPETMKVLIGRSLTDVVEKNLTSPLIPLRSIAVAGLSALSQTFLSEDALARRGLLVEDDRRVLESVVRRDDVVTLVGYGGMVENLVDKCRELHVTDMRSPDSLLTTIIGEGIEFAPTTIVFHGADEDEDILGRSDVVIITASSLVNGTIDELLRYSSNARVVGLYGPSASVTPDVLFEAGVDFVMSHHVRDPEIFVSDLTSDMNMESAIRKHQRYQTIVPERFKVQNGETAT